MSNPNLRLTVKTATGKSLIEMLVDSEADDEMLGYNLRHIFMGSLRDSGGEQPKYVVVETMN